MWVASNYCTADSNRHIKVSLTISKGATDRSKDSLYLTIFQVWPFSTKQHSQLLFFQPIPGDSEINESGLSLQFWLV